MQKQPLNTKQERTLFWNIWSQIYQSTGRDILRVPVLCIDNASVHYTRKDRVVDRKINMLDSDNIAIGLVYDLKSYGGRNVARAFGADVYIWNVQYKQFVGYKNFPYVFVKHAVRSDKDLVFRTRFDVSATDGKVMVVFLDKKYELVRKEPEKIMLNLNKNRTSNQKQH